MAQKLTLVLGNQLFPSQHYSFAKNSILYMAEDLELCTYFRFHKHKIVYFLTSMRQWSKEMEQKGFQLHYHQLKIDKISYEQRFAKFLDSNKIEHVDFFEIEDHFFAKRIATLLTKKKISFTIHQSPMFLCSREEFSNYNKRVKKPFMRHFYESMRKKHQILMESPKTPVGGKFSFDSENRKKIPKKFEVPRFKSFLSESDELRDVKALVNKEFKQHPGNADHYWAATNRSDSLKVLGFFLKKRMENFGSFQDALDDRDPFLFHSVISPYLNSGLITPDEVLKKTLEEANKNPALPLNSVEGFIRQVIGWREFIRGIYQHYDEKMQGENYWGHERALPQAFYDGSTGIPPVDEAISKANKYAYNHHIERLMVLASFMNLCGIRPQEVYRWFMEMYIDSSDWVMAANVYSMGLFSEGGIFATKPYICGSNYYKKMGHFKTGPWCDVVDGLYWGFVDRNRDFFSKNPRMSLMLKILDKMDMKKKVKIDDASEEFLEKHFSKL